MQIHVTIAELPTHAYPYAVRIDEGQEVTCRDLTHCRCVVAGMQVAFIALRTPLPTVVWDPRLEVTK